MGAAIFTAFNVVLQLVLLFTVEPGNYEVSHTFAGLVAFGVFFAVAELLIFAQFFLWLSMLWFLVKYDSFGIGWLLLMLFTLSVGAAVYYFFRYRKYFQHSIQRDK